MEDIAYPSSKILNAIKHKHKNLQSNIKQKDIKSEIKDFKLFKNRKKNKDKNKDKNKANPLSIEKISLLSKLTTLEAEVKSEILIGINEENYIGTTLNVVVGCDIHYSMLPLRVVIEMKNENSDIDEKTVISPKNIILTDERVENIEENIHSIYTNNKSFIQNETIKTNTKNYLKDNQSSIINLKIDEISKNIVNIDYNINTITKEIKTNTTYKLSTKLHNEIIDVKNTQIDNLLEESDNFNILIFNTLDEEQDSSIESIDKVLNSPVKKSTKFKGENLKENLKETKKSHSKIAEEFKKDKHKLDSDKNLKNEKELDDKINSSLKEEQKDTNSKIEKDLENNENLNLKENSNDKNDFDLDLKNFLEDKNNLLDKNNETTLNKTKSNSEINILSQKTKKIVIDESQKKEMTVKDKIDNLKKDLKELEKLKEKIDKAINIMKEDISFNKINKDIKDISNDLYNIYVLKENNEKNYLKLKSKIENSIHNKNYLKNYDKNGFKELIKNHDKIDKSLILKIYLFSLISNFLIQVQKQLLKINQKAIKENIFEVLQLNFIFNNILQDNVIDIKKHQNKTNNYELIIDSMQEITNDDKNYYENMMTSLKNNLKQYIFINISDVFKYINLTIMLIDKYYYLWDNYCYYPNKKIDISQAQRDIEKANATFNKVGKNSNKQKKSEQEIGKDING